MEQRHTTTGRPMADRMMGAAKRPSSNGWRGAATYLIGDKLRQALDFSTGKAIGSALLGMAAYVALTMVLGLAGGVGGLMGR